MITVYGAAPSPFVRKVLVCLNLKGLDYERIEIMPGSTPEDYIEISPLRKIPAITDGDFNTCDSSVICDYLDEKYPEVPTKPTTPELRARARWLEEYADTKLAEAASTLFLERILKGVVMGKDPNEERISKCINELIPERLAYLESVIPESGFLFGDDLMVTDVALMTHFMNAAYAGYFIDAEKWPKTAAYYKRVTTHPVLEERFEEESKVMGKTPHAA